jgi:hypothetical protein
MERKTMIGLLALFVFFATMLGVAAMEPTVCQDQRADDGQEWHYRTRVDGKPGECWYVGERMSRGVSFIGASSRSRYQRRGRWLMKSLRIAGAESTQNDDITLIMLAYFRRLGACKLFGFRIYI